MSQSNFPEEPETRAYASFSRRLGAALIDAAVLGTAGFLISMVYFHLIPNLIVFTVSDYLPKWARFAIPLTFGDLFESMFVIPLKLTMDLYDPYLVHGQFIEPIHGLDALLYVLIFPSLNWLYHAVMESSAKQATLGKMMLKIKVTDLNGNRISFLRATARHFSKIISTVILLFGFIMAALTKKKQALHDKMAGCLVVRRPSVC